MLSITNVTCCTESNSITVQFKTDGALSNYFKCNTSEVTYSDSIKDIPPSLAIVPFVANVLPIVWVLGDTLHLKEIDADFFESMKKIKAGYKKMYPRLSFDGNMTASSLVKNETPVMQGQDSAIELFSGGVDGLNTLVRNRELISRFVTVWGADIPSTNDEAWKIAYSGIYRQAEVFGVSSSYVKTDMRDFIDESKLTKLLNEHGYVGHAWWHDIQHSLALLGLSSLVAYIYGCTTMFIAASYSVNDTTYHQCASEPSIDNHFMWCGVKVVHDGYEENRQVRIQNIVDYANQKGMEIPIRACYASHTGTNCCNCEKCGRTILGIIAAGGKPSQYGFNCSRSQFNRLMHELHYYYPMVYDFYREMPDFIKTNNTALPKSDKWVLSPNFEQICANGRKTALWTMRSKLAHVYHKIRR